MSSCVCKIVISGYFCTGKTSVMNHLKTEMEIHKPKVYTTRSKRPGEVEGNPYTFITKEKFQELANIDALFDPIEYTGNNYASDKSALLDHDRWVVDILPDSWKVYREIPGVIGIYLVPPDDEELARRAKLRGDSEENIKKRLLTVNRDQNLEGYHFTIEPQSSLAELCGKIMSIVQSLTSALPVILT